MRVHRSNRMELLVGRLAEICAQPPTPATRAPSDSATSTASASGGATTSPRSAHDPMAHDPMAHDPMAHDPMAHDPMAHDPMTHDPMVGESIVVQGRGMERWIAMRLADRLGIWANATFPFPRKLIDDLLNAVLGDIGEHAAFFEPETMRWAVARELVRLRGEPAFTSIDRFLEGDEGGARLLQLSRRIASLFDHYAIYRPEMVLGWEQGQSPEDWQACLWRAISEGRRHLHMPARARALREALREAPREALREASSPRPPWLAGLPPRVVLFGLSTLPPLYLDILASMTGYLELHLFLLSPSREYWGDIRSQREQLRERRRMRGELARRAPVQLALDFDVGDELLHLEEGHPLLASLGKQGRDFQRTLEAAIDYLDDERDLYEEPGDACALHVLQSDLLNLHAPGDGTRAPLLAHDDDSIRVHSCHGAMREVEVLHDQLRDLFERDPSLDPEDVIVMAPDIDVYAPLIQTVFGKAASDASAPIPFRIAERQPRATEPWLDAFFRLLEVLQSRLPLAAVLDLLELETIRERFSIGDDELPTLHAWLHEAGVRWGADASHRSELGQPPTQDNTWRFGLDRLFMGFAMPEDEDTLFGGVLPLPGIEGSDAELLGRLAEFCETLFSFRARLRQSLTVAEWATLLAELADAMLRQSPRDGYERRLLFECLSTLASRATTALVELRFDLRAIIGEIEEALGQSASGASFLSGGITFCRLVPMRAIPFRVIALLGMNDESFPRRTPALSFDHRRNDPRPGDRSAREDDRYLFLEALLSARDHLLITYIGQSNIDGKQRPPSVVVGELLDTLARTYGVEGLSSIAANSATSGAESALDPALAIRKRLVVEHPLQAFSPRYFEPPERSGDARLFSYCEPCLQGAKALSSPRIEASDFLGGAFSLEAPPPDVLQLEQLVSWTQRPVRSFVERQLEVSFESAETSAGSAAPFLDQPLERHQLGQQMLELVLDSPSLRSIASTNESDLLDAVRASLSGRYERFRAGGSLPWGLRGKVAYEALLDEVAPIASAALGLRAGEALDPLFIDLPIHPTIRIQGELRSLYPGGRVIQAFIGQTDAFARRELGLWITHLALQLSGASARSSHFVARPQREGRPTCVSFAPLEPASARALLQDLLALYLEAIETPLPFVLDASRRYIEALSDPKRAASALALAEQALAPDGSFTQGADAYVQRLFPDPAAMVRLEAFDRAAHAILGPWLHHREVSA